MTQLQVLEKSYLAVEGFGFIHLKSTVRGNNILAVWLKDTTQRANLFLCDGCVTLQSASISDPYVLELVQFVAQDNYEFLMEVPDAEIL